MLRRFWPLLAPYRRSFVLGFVLMLFAAPATHVHQLLWKVIVDDGILGRRVDVVVQCILVILVVHLLGNFVGAWIGWLGSCVGHRVVADLRARLHAKLVRQSMAYVHGHRAADLVSRVGADVDLVYNVAPYLMGSLAQQVLNCAFMVAALLWLSWELTVISLLPMIGVWLLVRFYNERGRALFRRLRDRLGEVSFLLQEHLEGLPVIKAFAREPERDQVYRAALQANLQDNLAAARMTTWYGSGVPSFTFLSSMLVGAAGIWLIFQGRFTLGALMAFRGYVGSLMAAVQWFTSVNEQLQKMAGGTARIFELLDAPDALPDAPDAASAAGLAGRLAFEGVGFRYAADRPVLESLTFEVAPGRRLAIVGPSGAGKSTVLALALRFHDPLTGAVRLGGRDLRALRQREVRRRMALVHQEPFLFDATVRENLLLARPEAALADLEQAATLANAAEFVAGLPERWDTRVGERGARLSTGQKQRLCLARAFLANPDVLLLDEPTAAVEAESEALLLDAIERLMEGRTTVVVTHRLSMARGADEILVLDRGRAVERGTHDELLAQGGWYARMWRLQTGS